MVNKIECTLVQHQEGLLSPSLGRDPWHRDLHGADSAKEV